MQHSNMLKRTIIIVLVIMSLSDICNAQMRDSDKIYWLALKEFVITIDSVYSKNTVIFKSKEIFLQKPELVDSIPVNIDGYRITLINATNQKQLYTNHKNHLIHTVMFPVAVEDSLIYVTFTPYRGELKKRNHYKLAVSDGTTVYFKFDCNERKFKVFKIDNWGI